MFGWLQTSKKIMVVLWLARLSKIWLKRWGPWLWPKKESWHYQTPKLSDPVATVSLGLDGTCMLICEEGGRQAMVGSLSLYDSQGERLHSTYVAAAPEYGRQQFLARMQREVEHLLKLYPEAHRQGLADGASENWDFLAPYVDSQVLDFYHASGYLKKVAKVLYPRSRKQRQAWTDHQAHRLMHEIGAAKALLDEFEAIELDTLSEQKQQELKSVITYFRNHHHQMNYAQTREANRPIGSGVTESGLQSDCQTTLMWFRHEMEGNGRKYSFEFKNTDLYDRAMATILVKN